MRLRQSILSFVFLMAFGVMPIAAAHALDISLSVDIFSPPPVAVAPPPLPVYVVPAPPVANYIWAPGHWLWGDAGYFWVPGTWVAPPAPGLLWTPGYWGWNQAAFAWHEGYWAPHVGFYGGVAYGGGYDGVGFVGGGWHNNQYVVNRSVTNVTNITNVTNVTNVSFNGGPGGVTAVPTAQQNAYANERHMAPTTEQQNHIRAASSNPAFAASANHGKPSVAATTRPGVFSGQGVVAADHAGMRNAEAEKHNAAVRQNPDLAKGAALPRGQDHPRNNASVVAPQKPEAPRPEAVAHPQAPHPNEGEGMNTERPHEEAAPAHEHEEEARPHEEKAPAENREGEGHHEEEGHGEEER